ncbi:hypothetical protein TNIN_51531 [Trichonephila inaurata madagascariensis]|uniref:Uncharacterized protein n=1 Tax=Trichonephila inaurata madagascariensis TaxID=2747483 RepID=A0A8X6YJJ4_9ARAC|nr:hypothetical protein TNIN_51531 [Trichonephila inaurata madagascariensis]
MESKYREPSLERLEKMKQQDRRFMQRAFVDPTVTRSTIPLDEWRSFTPRMISRLLVKVNLQSKRPFRVLPF